MSRNYVEDERIARDVVFSPDEDARVRVKDMADESIESVIDGAVASGRIAMAERDAWRRRLHEHPELGWEIISTLPLDPARGNPRLGRHGVGSRAVR